MNRQVALVGVAALLMGCAGAAPTATVAPTASPSLAPTATAAPATPSPTPEPTATVMPTPTLAGLPVTLGGAAGTTGITLFFVPAFITVPAGDTTFLLTNTSDGPHNMVIGPEAPSCTDTKCTFGPSIAVSTTVAPRSGPEEFVVENLAAGTYPFWCSIQGHAVLGMIGRLTVEP